MTALIALALLGFAWGLLFSDRARTSFGAVLGAVVGQAAALPFFMGLAAGVNWLFAGLSLDESHRFLLPCLALLAIGGPIVVSGFGQAWLDRLHRRQLDPPLGKPGWRGAAGRAACGWIRARGADCSCGWRWLRRRPGLGWHL